MGNLIETPEFKVPSLNPGEVQELKELEVTTDDMLFVSQYVTTHSPGAAYASVYQCDQKAAQRLGVMHLARPKIQKALTIFYKKVGEALLLDSKVVYAKVWEIANDPSAKHSDRLRALEMLNGMIKDVEKGEDDEASLRPVVNVLINAVGGEVKAETSQGKAKKIEIYEHEAISVGPKSDAS